VGADLSHTPSTQENGAALVVRSIFLPSSSSSGPSSIPVIGFTTAQYHKKRRFIFSLMCCLWPSVQAKPADRSAWWRRARLERDGTLTVRSRKLQWWLLTLGLEAHANPRTRTANLSYRVATKWDVSKGEYRNKRRAALGEAAEARAHWWVDYKVPEVAG
jgi:hypothetical protein